jgi:PKD repeat protein
MRIGRESVRGLRFAVVCFAVLATCIALAPAASAGEWLLSGSDLSEGSQPRTAMNSAGEAVAVFQTSGGVIGASIRPVGGTFSGGVFGETVSNGLHTEAPDVAIDLAGDIMVVWQQGEGPAQSQIYTSFRRAGGSFGTPVAISSTGASAPEVAMDARGDATAVWLLDDGTSEIVQAATAAQAGSFSVPVALSGDGGNAASAEVSTDPAGDTVVSWTRTVAGVSELEDALARAGGGFAAPDSHGDGSIIGESDPGSIKEPAEPPLQQVAMGGGGEALAVWRTHSDEVRVARLGPHGSVFGVPVTLGSSTATPSVAMNEAGDGVVCWPIAAAADVATASPGGVFDAPTSVATLTGTTPGAARLAVASDGAVAMAWVTGSEGKGGTGTVVQEATFRPPGGTFSTPKGLFAGTGGLLAPRSLELASDAYGDVFGVWQENISIGDNVDSITYDNGPVIENVSMPTGGQTGEPLSFSIPPPVSVWKPVKAVTWNFGDGTTGNGLSTTHTYTRPGVYDVTVSASDGQALPFRPITEYVSTSVSRTLTITSPPNGSHAPLVAASTPVIVDVSQTHSVWREGQRVAHSGRTSRQPPLGTTFSLSLNENATASLVFTQRITGNRAKGRCVARTERHRKSPSCKRIITRGTMSFAAHMGTNKMYFQGRISHQMALKPGRYVLVITATNAAGKHSSPTSLTFTIVK